MLNFVGNRALRNHLLRNILVQSLQVLENLRPSLFDVSLLVTDALQLIKNDTSPLLGGAALVCQGNLVLDGSLDTAIEQEKTAHQTSCKSG